MKAIDFLENWSRRNEPYNPLDYVPPTSAYFH